jgi:hypothetical protein
MKLALSGTDLSNINVEVANRIFFERFLGRFIPVYVSAMTWVQI